MSWIIEQKFGRGKEAKVEKTIVITDGEPSPEKIAKFVIENRYLYGYLIGTSLPVMLRYLEDGFEGTFEEALEELSNRKGKGVADVRSKLNVLYVKGKITLQELGTGLKDSAKGKEIIDQFEKKWPGGSR